MLARMSFRLFAWLLFSLLCLATLFISLGGIATPTYFSRNIPYGGLLYFWVIKNIPAATWFLGVFLFTDLVLGAVPRLSRMRAPFAAFLVFGVGFGYPVIANGIYASYGASITAKDIAPKTVKARGLSIALAGIRDAYVCNTLCEMLLKTKTNAIVSILTEPVAGDLSLPGVSKSFMLTPFDGERCKNEYNFRKQNLGRKQKLQMNTGQTMCVTRVPSPDQADLLLMRDYDHDRANRPASTYALRVTTITVMAPHAVSPRVVYRKTDAINAKYSVPLSFLNATHWTGAITGVKFGDKTTNTGRDFSDWITAGDAAELTQILLSLLPSG
ncbi:hypothetical protein [Marimonas lutisalis]|uniref:hypothetical protein n=1 Tax=Marimonas lutisalis TaxID=2545756 RepID=UPI0010F941B1|nr:hypothetical protein [Marimonas lutisalis]